MCNRSNSSNRLNRLICNFLWAVKKSLFESVHCWAANSKPNPFVNCFQRSLLGVSTEQHQSNISEYTRKKKKTYIYIYIYIYIHTYTYKDNVFFLLFSSHTPRCHTAPLDRMPQPGCPHRLPDQAQNLLRDSGCPQRLMLCLSWAPPRPPGPPGSAGWPGCPRGRRPRDRRSPGILSCPG